MMLAPFFLLFPVLQEETPPPEVPAPAEEETTEEIVEDPEEEADEEEEEEAEEESPYLAIVGGRVHTVTRGTLPRATVLCKNGRIMKIGSRVRVPEGARVIDAKGHHVYPGLVAVNSSGVVSGSGTGIRDSFDPFSINVDLALAGGITTVQAGNAVAKLTRGSLDGLLTANGPWVTLSYTSTSPGGRRGLRASLDKARDHMRAAREHELDPDPDKGDSPSDKEVDSNHLALLRGEKTARFNASGLKDLLAVCDFLEEYPMKSVVWGGQEAWACAGRLGRTGTSLVISPRAKRQADSRLNRDSGWSIENAAILHAAGIPFAIIPQRVSIDRGGIAGRDLLALAMEAAFAIRGGLPQKEALKALTMDAAGILGVSDRVGSLETGKDADIIICDGDLFDYRTFVQWAVVNGKVVYDKAKAPYFAHIRPRESQD